MSRLADRKFYLSFWKKETEGADRGKWINVFPDGTEPGSGRIYLNPYTFNIELDGDLILDDNPIQWALAKELQAVEADTMSLRLANKGLIASDIADGRPFALFSKPNYKMMLSVRIHQNVMNGRAPAVLLHEQYYLIFTGFMTASRILRGGEELELQFADLSYWMGEERFGKIYAHVKREELLEDIVDQVPFVLDTDVNVTELPEVSDMRELLVSSTGTRFAMEFMFDPQEIARINDTEIAARLGNFVYKIDLVTGVLDTIGIDSEMEEIFNLLPKNRLWHDPAIWKTNYTGSNLPYYYIHESSSEDKFIPGQTFNWRTNTLYYAYYRESSGYVVIRFREWDDTAGYGAQDTLTMFSGDEHDISDDNLMIWAVRQLGYAFADFLIYSKTSNSIVYQEALIYGDNQYSKRNLGAIKQYVPGHVLEEDGGLVAYPFLGKRLDSERWFWLRIEDSNVGADKIVVRDAEFSSAGASLVENIPDFELRHLNFPGFKNKLCFQKLGDEYHTIVVVDSKFTIIEEFYSGEKLPRSGHEAPVPLAYDFVFTLVGSDFKPFTLARHPQYKGGAESTVGDPIGYDISEVKPMILDQDTPNYCARLNGIDESVGRVLSKFAATDCGWWWIRPDMVLQYRNPGPAEIGNELLPEIQRNAGDEDVVESWEENYTGIEVDYGDDRNKLLGRRLWGHKTKKVDLKEVIFSADYAEMIGLGYYLIYGQPKDKVTAPVYRPVLLQLWDPIIIHGEWIVIYCQFDFYNLNGEIQGIRAPLALGGAIAVTDSFWAEFMVNSQCQWYYYGMYFDGPAEAYPGIDARAFIGERYGWPGHIIDALRTIMDAIATALTNEVGCWPDGESAAAAFDLWWRENRMDYWDDILALLDELRALGFTLEALDE